MVTRRQSRPFRARELPDGAAAVTPPSLDLLEHLEEVYAGEGAMGVMMRSNDVPDTSDNIVRETCYEAGIATVLAYLRELIERAKEAR